MRLWDIENDNDNFDDDGVYAVPRGANEPRIKVRALLDYCKEKGIEPEQVPSEILEQFLDYGKNKIKKK